MLRYVSLVAWAAGLERGQCRLEASSAPSNLDLLRQTDPAFLPLQITTISLWLMAIIDKKQVAQCSIKWLSGIWTQGALDMSDTREEDLMRCLAQGGAGTIEKKVREVESDNVKGSLPGWHRQSLQNSGNIHFHKTNFENESIIQRIYRLDCLCQKFLTLKLSCFPLKSNVLKYISTFSLLANQFQTFLV
jgi:hypothetical protein